MIKPLPADTATPECERYHDTVSAPRASDLAQSQAAIDQLAPAAIAALADILQNGSDRAKLEAAKTLLDRAGLSARPRTAEKTQEKSLDSLTLEEVEALLASKEAERAAAAKPVSATELARKDKQLSDLID